MRPPIVFMFSGQGSHYYQMGRALYEQDRVFRHWMHEGDELMCLLTGFSIIEELYTKGRGKGEVFDRTLITHPTILVTEYALSRMLASLGVVPDYVLGSSLGEWAAAMVAEVTGFEEAIYAVVRQAELLEGCPPGGMMAILDSVERYHRDPMLHARSTCCSVNFDQHFVVAGLRDDIDALERYLKKQRVTVQQLAVTQAFHSRHIESIADEYTTFLATRRFRPPSTPFVSGCRAQRLEALPDGYFWETVRGSIRFAESIQLLEQMGSYRFIDLGPSGTLATFARQNLPPGSASEVYSIMTPFGREVANLEKLQRGLEPSRMRMPL